ncbi:MAG TPA: trans-aconitate 2-methyltransferase [Casimicrobiaceae bacterium]
MTWSAQQYVAFENERTRPVRDLLAAVPTRDVHRAIDIGCGPGNSTEALLARFPHATVSGIDSSSDMLAAARKRLPEVRFEQTDIGAWRDEGPFDVILANAVLQWLPDHARVLPALVAKLAPAGSLAVQMPDNLDEPAHRLMREVAANGSWTAKLADVGSKRAARHAAQWYYELLRPLCGAVDVWRTTYHHRLEGGANGVVEWFKGSGLRPFLDPLDDAEREAYLERYTRAIAQAHPPLRDNSVLLPFPRLFIVATR